MGALAHYLESDGLATAQISLVRQHTAVIKPPRALWVPFELGRPLGVPIDAAFQSQVLRHVLALLEAPSGPLLVDYPEDVPDTVASPTALVCPVNFASPQVEMSDTEHLRAALQEEISQLRTWYDLSVSRRSRTTMGVSGLAPEELGTFISAFLEGTAPSNTRQDIPLATVFRFAVEDLKTYYMEAITAQPGQHTADSMTLADWFWRETMAGRVLFAVQEACKQSDIPGLHVVISGALIPRARRADSPFARA